MYVWYWNKHALFTAGNIPLFYAAKQEKMQDLQWGLQQLYIYIPQINNAGMRAADANSHWIPFPGVEDTGSKCASNN